jgi:hypothetical protein
MDCAMGPAKSAPSRSFIFFQELLNGNARFAHSERRVETGYIQLVNEETKPMRRTGKQCLLVVTKPAAPRAILPSIQDPVRLAAPVLDVLRTIWSGIGTKPNGHSFITSN